MLQILKKSDNLLVVVHEIYGINQHIKDFCDLLSQQDFDVICPNLLDLEQPFGYSEEKLAHLNFMENIGFPNAVHKIKSLVSDFKGQYEVIYIIGFSIGATVAWLCSEEQGLSGVVGFYGSRIRNYTEIVPQCPAILFFPEEEESFNVDEVISKLDKKNVKVHKLLGQHGFSDPYSSKFNEKAAKEAFNEMVTFLKKL
ncbi:dienelactone hydrolase family protein [Bacillus sp. JJ1521]|uniref:dienelactone hydrolase family protein n=1 Tax=Bacillus sp. JJ1521 TaxID=3122957 RepID=UPI002FFEE242